MKRDEPVVCGIDLGSSSTPSYVAWLRGRRFLLDLYLASVDHPLPEAPRGWPMASWIAIDGPQGLPAAGTLRVADRAAQTPVRTLPSNRTELETWRLYRSFIRTSLDVFWSVYSRRLATVAGLRGLSGGRIVVAETYPRFVIRRLWPDLAIPSKRKQAVDYCNVLWKRLRAVGYRCDSVLRPTVDQIDAMLCAVAAEAAQARGACPDGTVGRQPIVDRNDEILREGFILAPC